MSFELLANETILDLFEYIPIFDLFHGFYNLNSRFNRLLQFRKFHLDFRLLSKIKCNSMCENYVPLIIDRIISLHLSNDDDTSQLIEIFLSQRFQLRQLTHLQSITISFLQSYKILDQIMIECSYLSCLTHLSFIDDFVTMNENQAQCFCNHIWSLKNLTYCHFHIFAGLLNYFPNPTVISKSLKYLIIQKLECSLPTLSNLCHHTPNLEHLSARFQDLLASFQDFSNQLNSILPIQSISRLNICFASSFDILKQLLRNLPNLRHLKLEINGIYINGCQWEEIIHEYLPKLEVFQLKMYFVRLNNEDKEIELNKIVDTYRTKFWIKEHRRFVRCDWCDSENADPVDQIYLFTLPYSFRGFDRTGNCILTKSTSPFDEEYLVCNKVKSLSYNSSSFMTPISSLVRFNNLTSLSLSLPFNDQLLSIIPKLDWLVSLSVSVRKDENVDTIEPQLQLLLNQTVRLRSLSFGKWLPRTSPVPPTEITSVSVRRLNLVGYTFDDDWRCYDEDACIQLCRSSLGQQCEILWIAVKNRRNILDLMNNMPHLQSMKVQCDDDTWSADYESVSSVGDGLIEWLRHCLPSCTITRYESRRNIRLWIR